MEGICATLLKIHNTVPKASSRQKISENASGFFYFKGEPKPQWLRATWGEGRQGATLRGLGVGAPCCHSFLSLQYTVTTFTKTTYK